MRTLLLLLAVVAVIGCGSSGSSGPVQPGPDGCPADPPSLVADAGSHALKTVFVIVLENTAWSQVEGSASAPYVNGTLLPRFAHATNYRSGGPNHSLPNYLILEAGDNLGVIDNVLPRDVQLSTTCHLATWLEATGLTWRSYQEGISGTDCPLENLGTYAPRHDPFLYFGDVVGAPPSASSARCIEHVRPYAELERDLQAGTVARYNFITPDLCHGGHDSCPPANDRVRQQDDWLAAELPRIQASQAWQRGGVILVTWDEPDAGDAPIGLIAVSPLAKPGHAGTVPYGSHGATVRTVQEILGLRPFLRRAETEQSLSDLFETYP